MSTSATLRALGNLESAFTRGQLYLDRAREEFNLEQPSSTSAERIYLKLAIEEFELSVNANIIAWNLLAESLVRLTRSYSREHFLEHNWDHDLERVITLRKAIVALKKAAPNPDSHEWQTYQMQLNSLEVTLISAEVFITLDQHQSINQDYFGVNLNTVHSPRFSPEAIEPQIAARARLFFARVEQEMTDNPDSIGKV